MLPGPARLRVSGAMAMRFLQSSDPSVSGLKRLGPSALIDQLHARADAAYRPRSASPPRGRAAAVSTLVADASTRRATSGPLQHHRAHPCDRMNSELSIDVPKKRPSGKAV